MVPRTTRTVGLDAVLADDSARPEVDGVELRTLPLPVDSSVWPVLQVPIPMTEELWNQMLDDINVFKRGVVRKAASAEDQPPAEPPTSPPE
jgi:hypothetical protein